MAASTRARVASLTLDSPLTTRETVLSPTPASAATSRMVAARTCGSRCDNVFSGTGSQKLDAFPEPDKSRVPALAARIGIRLTCSTRASLSAFGEENREPFLLARGAQNWARRSSRRVDGFPLWKNRPAHRQGRATSIVRQLHIHGGLVAANFPERGRLR